MITKELRIVLPFTIEEYQIGQLWSVVEASKNETGGGEGIEVLENHPYDDEEHGKGQYTYKIYHIASRIPSFAKMIMPKGSLEFHEEAWNGYPYNKTVITNPKYMKDNFILSIESWHKPDFGETENVHNLPPKLWKKTEVIHVDIVNDHVSSSDYKPEHDPLIFSPKVEGRGPLTRDWIQRLKSQGGDSAVSKMPHMCAYKLIRCNFKWLGLQHMTEKFIQRQERRVFTNFHREVYCWMDNWFGLTIEDIRKIEDQAQGELREMREKGNICGTKVHD